MSLERDQPPEYLVGHIEDALARDPRVAEQGLRADVRGDPPRVVITGIVTDIRCKAAIPEVIDDLLPGCEVRDETTVADYAEPGDTESVP